MYKGKIVKITDEEAFVMVKEYEFVRIKRRAGMIVGDEIEFSTEDIIVYDEGIQDSQLKNSSKSSRVERFTRISGMGDKESLKGDKIEGF
ncbi:MAG TPA: anti-sigma factor domain-containing protein, partial [Acetivibrio saccincola]|nr:anti-sigma factor domain-containing protein [Acetivibrio saccincola]